MKIHERELLVGDSASFGVGTIIEPAANYQAGRGLGGSDQIHDNLVSDEGLAAPVLRDEREQSVLDLVPFASSGR